MKKNLLITSAVATIAFATPHALAQSGDDGASDDDYLDTITIQAQRREQNILDVPVAVSTLTPDALQEQQVDDVIDLNRVSPSVFSNSLSSPLSNAPVRIRGIGTGGGNPGFEGAVGVYVDEVFRSRAGAALTTFFDMAGVDILRGPQGTLFGKNTTAGAILQRTAAPEFGEVGGYLAAEGANFSSYEVEGALNLPLGDNGAFRLSGMLDHTDGFFTDPFTGENTADSQIEAIRGQVAYDLADNLTFRLIADWSSWRTSGNYGRSTRINSVDADGAQNALFGPLALGLVAGPSTGTGYWYWDITNPTAQANPFDYKISTSQIAEQDMDQWGVSGYFDFDLSDQVTIRSITSYRAIRSDNLDGDWEFGPTAFAGKLDVWQDFDTFSQEILLYADFDMGGIETEFIGGFHYFNEEIDYTRLATVGPAWSTFVGIAIGAPIGPADPTFGDPTFPFQNINYIQNEDSYGLFGHVTLNLTDSLALIGGVRWNKIDKDVDFTNLNGSSTVYHDLAATRAQGLYLINAALSTAFPWSSSISDEELTYNITAQWRPTDASQLYFNYSRGFKAGGFNLTENAAVGTPFVGGSVVVDGRTFNPLDVDGAAFAPEFVDAYEIGYRLEYLDRGRLSLTGFFLDYTDLQVSVFNGQTFEVFNAGSSEVKGIELENFFVVSDELELNLGLTYLDATYGDDVVSLPAGRQRGLSPDVSLVVGATYDRPITDDLNLYANASFSYYTSMFLAEGQCSDAAGDPVPFGDECSVAANSSNLLTNQKQDGYGIMVASLGVRINDDWDFSLFCDNCFEEEYFTYAFNQTFHGDSIIGNPGAPRVWGGRIRKDF